MNNTQRNTQNTATRPDNFPPNGQSMRNKRKRRKKRNHSWTIMIVKREITKKMWQNFDLGIQKEPSTKRRTDEKRLERTKEKKKKQIHPPSTSLLQTSSSSNHSN
ncbi:hypothetical protein L873DRAFT_1242263 [Choiromyces venosus 120613-1]|uniref:Uncharacterized protein n=1 Tax=Choiromyces venosus 120613-1 TaxID=1336337 RepID=A0A3N4JDA8_9PEZI|nr:hypothetical protein L873DRAFT_1242263 [Choiromyces venosus 120613-1]